MRGYVEAFFRHKYLLCLPVVLGFVVGTSLALQAPRGYVATASFWVDTPVPEASTVGTTGGESPPSAGATALLTQMLATRTFLRSAVERSPLADKFDGLSSKGTAGKVRADQMLGPVASSVVVAATGPQVVSVSVTRKNAGEAAGLANAILKQFRQARSDLEVERARAEVRYAQRILAAAESAGGGPTPRPGRRGARDRRADDERLSDAQTAYQQAAVGLQTATTSKLQVIDHPDVAIPQSRMKKVAFGAVGGTMAGFTTSLLALILIVARDRSMRNERDVTAALGLEVVGSLPREKRNRRSRRGRSDDGSRQSDVKVHVPDGGPPTTSPPKEHGVRRVPVGDLQPPEGGQE